MQDSAKTVLITGSTDGIGLAAAREIAKRGHRVLVHGRNPEKTKKACAEVAKAATGPEPSLYVADLASLEAVRSLADSVIYEEEVIDVLINNAGVVCQDRRTSEDGYEMTFAVNHLSHFLLTELLLDCLEKSTQGRIVTVSSLTHSWEEIDWSDLQCKKSYQGNQAYARSKLMNLLFSNHLAKRLEGGDMTSNALHPGVVDTKLLHEAGFGGGCSWEQGAETHVFLALDDSVRTVSGKYFSDCSQETPSPSALNKSDMERLHQISLEMTGLY